MKRLRIGLVCLVCLATPITTPAAVYDYLLSGVDYANQHGFYDVNKIFDGHDDLFCWSFSAANHLQRWQDKQDSAIIAAKGIPNGYSGLQRLYSLDIAYRLAQSWERGTGFELRAFTWWVTGQLLSGDPVDPGAEVGGPIAPGGFWSDYVPVGTYLGEQVDVDRSDDPGFLFNLIRENTANDYGMTLGIGGHAIGLWGGGYDTTLGTHWLYITDSDDRQTVLYRSHVHLDQFNYWRFDDGERFAGDIVSNMTFLTLGVIPEPSTLALIVGVIAGFAGVRLRRPGANRGQAGRDC